MNLRSWIQVSACALGAASLWAQPEAQAAAYLVEARTEAQAYQIRAYRDSNPENPVLLPRRRLVQYLSLNAFELVTGSDLHFESNLRFFADFGLSKNEAALVDGTRSSDADLLYAHINYRRGGFGLRVGRQVYADMMDIMAFDGATARYLWGAGIGVEAYGGLWVKGSSFLGSSVYQPDGTRETDARRIALGAPNADPALGSMEPVFGAKLLAQGLRGFGGSLGYRRSMVGGKVDLERAALELRYGRGLGFNALAGADYDLFFAKLAQVRAQVRYDWPVYALTVEAMRLAPVLSSDSIWYYFANAPRDEARVRGDFTPVGPLRYYAQLVFSHYNTQLNDDGLLTQGLDIQGAPSSSTAGGSVGSAGRWGPIRAAADLTYRGGVGARQLWVDLTGGYAPEFRRYSVDGRISIANVADSLNPLLRGSFYGFQAWGSYLLAPSARLSLLLEENVNPFTRLDTKVFLVLDLRAAL